MREAGSKSAERALEDEMRAITACQQGDRDAFGLVVRRYAGRAISAARWIVRDRALAEDAAQEAFVRAFRAIKRFKRGEPFYPWFYRILRNCCFTLLRRRRRKGLSLDAEQAPVAVATSGDPVEAASRSERRAIVRAAVARLSAPHREILHLAHFEGLAYREIAACLAIPIGTVMSRLWAARQALKRELLDG